MKIIIAGDRNYTDYQSAKPFLLECISDIKSQNITVLSGDCEGADKLGEQFAQEMGFNIEHHPALWNEYGKKAGPIRNKEMAENANMLICFWNGKSKGTANMIAEAKKCNIKIFIKKI